MPSSKLYALELDLSTNNGGIPREKFEDWMRVRLFGHSDSRHVVIPPTLVGSIYFHNDGDGEVTLRCGAAIPIKLDRGDIIHAMFNGHQGGMRKVGF